MICENIKLGSLPLRHTFWSFWSSAYWFIMIHMKFYTNQTLLCHHFKVGGHHWPPITDFGFHLVWIQEPCNENESWHLMAHEKYVINFFWLVFFLFGSRPERRHHTSDTFGGGRWDWQGWHMVVACPWVVQMPHLEAERLCCGLLTSFELMFFPFRQVDLHLQRWSGNRSWMLWSVSEVLWEGRGRPQRCQMAGRVPNGLSI